jgi:hypothetical protein
VHYPPYFANKHAANHLEFFLHWIDEDERKATMDARKAGVTFEPVIESFEQYRRQEAP